MSVRRNAQRDGEVAENATAYTVTAPLDLISFMDRLGHDAVGEGLADASEDSPGTLWVLAEVEGHAVRRAASAPQGVEAPDQTVHEADRLRTKVQAGEDLTPDEVQTALRLLLTRGA